MLLMAVQLLLCCANAPLIERPDRCACTSTCMPSFVCCSLIVLLTSPCNIQSYRRYAAPPPGEYRGVQTMHGSFVHLDHPGECPPNGWQRPNGHVLTWIDAIPHTFHSYIPANALGRTGGRPARWARSHAVQHNIAVLPQHSGCPGCANDPCSCRLLAACRRCSALRHRPSASRPPSPPFPAFFADSRYDGKLVTSKQVEFAPEVLKGAAPARPPGTQALNTTSSVYLGEHRDRFGTSSSAIGQAAKAPASPAGVTTLRLLLAGPAYALHAVTAAEHWQYTLGVACRH